MKAILDEPVKPFEIIIIDDGSTDNSLDVIKGLAKHKSGIRYFQNDQNRGVSYTLNRGIDLAQGDYAFFPAADDQIMPGFLEKSLSLLAKYPQAGLSCTIGDWHELSTGLNWHMGNRIASKPCYISPAEMVALDRKGRLYIPGNTIIMRRQALVDAGKYLVELKHVNDWFADYVVGFRHGICFVPEPLARFNIHPNSYYKRNLKDKKAYRGVL